MPTAYECAGPRYSHIPATALVVLVGIFTLLGATPAGGCVLDLTNSSHTVTTPYQRAVVRFQDGVEKLLISTEVYDQGGPVTPGENGPATDAEEYLWLLPLPCAPKEAGAGSSIPANMLVPITGPNVLTPKPGDFLALPFLALISALLVWLVFRPRDDRLRRRLKILLGVLVALVTAPILLLLLSLGGRAPLSGQGFLAEKSDFASLACADTTILKPKSAAELDATLLGQFGVTPPKACAPAVGRHIENGGAFCAVKLPVQEPWMRSSPPVKHRSASVMIEFKTDTPICPIPLTSSPSEELRLDLIVLGDTVFTGDSLRLESAARCDSKSYNVWQFGTDAVPDNRPASCEVYDLQKEFLKTTLGFPALTALLWDGCVITRLSGTWTAGEITEDIRLRPGLRPLPYRATVAVMPTIVLRTAFHASLAGLLWMVGLACVWGWAQRHAHKVVRVIAVLLVCPILYGVGAAYSGGISKVNENVTPWQRNMNTDHLRELVERNTLQQGVLPEYDPQDAIMDKASESLLRFSELGPKETDWYCIFEDERGLVCRVFDVREDAAIEHAFRIPNLPAIGQPRPVRYGNRPSVGYWMTFLGEPMDIILKKKDAGHSEKP